MPQSKAPLSLAFDLPFDEAIVAALARAVILPDEYYGVLQGVARARAVSVAGLTSLSQIQAIIDAVGEALGNGTTFADFVAGVKDEQLTLSKGRLDNIFRTNIQDAYGSGRYEQQKANFDSRPYLMYDAINDSRTRPNRIVMLRNVAVHLAMRRTRAAVVDRVVHEVRA